MSSKKALDATLPRRAFKVYAGGYILFLTVTGALILLGAYGLAEGMELEAKTRLFRFLAGILSFSFLLAVAMGLVAASRIVGLFDEVFAENRRTIAELSVLTDNIAHDLRTPLTHLVSAAELAAAGQTADLPAIVAEESSSMLAMINTMLEISQSGARIERSGRETLDIAATARRIAEFYRMVAEEKNISFSVFLPEAPVWFSGHEAKVRQMLANLLDNAFKFTSRGGEVRLTLAEKKHSIEISVSDTGCGIAPEDAGHVFERFWRADSSRSLPGNGLGLALVKAIATSYAGRITFKSSIAGTTFTLSLPK